MASENAIIDQQPQSETGVQIHRRETRRQIYLPFALGLLALLFLVLLVALPSNPIWRLRAEAIADWMVTILCLLPLVLCLFPLFLLAMVGIWGMGRVHASTERPLRKLENMASKFADRVHHISEYIVQKTTEMSESVEPAIDKIDAFKTDELTEKEMLDD